jgi:hypothetical protein
LPWQAAGLPGSMMYFDTYGFLVSIVWASGTPCDSAVSIVNILNVEPN